MKPAALLLAQNSESLFKRAAQIFTESVAKAIEERGMAAVAISGGSTPKGLFQTLTETYHARRIEWSRLHFFWVDERCVPPQSPESNYGVARATLLSKVGVPESNIHRMAGEMKDPFQAARAYEDELKAFFKLTKSPPRFDLVLLGVGEDGHTASLFPGSEAAKESERWVVSTFVEKLHSSRITLTLPILNNSRRILILVAGNSKSEILKSVLTSEAPRYPIELVHPENGELTWLFDSEAAAKLPSTVRYSALHI
jgi:6-phosphogluconolactonase